MYNCIKIIINTYNYLIFYCYKCINYYKYDYIKDKRMEEINIEEGNIEEGNIELINSIVIDNSTWEFINLEK